MTNRHSITVRRYLTEQWNEVVGVLGRLSNVADVRPDGAEAVFVITQSQEPNVVSFEIKPVVFNLPERANDTSLDLFVVVSGRLGIGSDPDNRRGNFITHEFSTKAAYFRRSKAELIHVYGAHYDFALNEIGHPTFHMQLRSFSELASYVKDNYNGIGDVKDCMEGVLRNVRLPCAQMDFFSFFTQICADHLLFKDSGEEERAAFNHLLEISHLLRGAAARSQRMIEVAAQNCYRAGHWYPATS